MTQAESAEYKSFTTRIDEAIRDAEKSGLDPADPLGSILESAMRSVVFVHVKRYCGRRLAGFRARRAIASQAEMTVRA